MERKRDTVDHNQSYSTFIDCSHYCISPSNGKGIARRLRTKRVEAAAQIDYNSTITQLIAQWRLFWSVSFTHAHTHTHGHIEFDFVEG